MASAALSVRPQQVVLGPSPTPSDIAIYAIMMQQAFRTHGWIRLIKPSRSVNAKAVSSVLDYAHDDDDDLVSVGGIDAAPPRAAPAADERARLDAVRAKAVLDCVDYDSDEDHTAVADDEQ